MASTEWRNLLGGLMLLGCVGLADAQITSPVFQQAQTTGMVGLADGQTARLNVLYPGVPAPLATGIICSAQLIFLNDQGSVLKTALVHVTGGKSASLDLSRPADLAVHDQRVQIRATIQVPPVPAGSGTPPQVRG